MREVVLQLIIISDENLVHSQHYSLESLHPQVGIDARWLERAETSGPDNGGDVRASEATAAGQPGEHETVRGIHGKPQVA